MRRLVIDCATEACSVALFEGGHLLGADHAMLGRGHAERLVPMIGDLPDGGRAEVIAVDTGPGSFTGIRVGLAAARALALAWGATVEGYSSLALVAAMARHVEHGETVDVAMTGGHGEWFFQSFAADGAPLGDAASLSPAAAQATSQAPLVAGSQAEALVAARGHGRALPLWPDARAALLLRAQDLALTPTAFYGRAPDARLPASA